MNHSLGKCHLQAARRALHASKISVDILEGSIARVWTSSAYSDRSSDQLDFEAAISGDDLARINAFEPADPNLKSIGEQHGLWSDIRHHAGRWAA
ncbi:hypothetical protein [Brevibacterium aurantiacum]|uniref:hypothetical protein n=1 Tax=Brevibacterium aurantiacum TaxID=273384 RepID=UPI001642B12E|nr:hypothetical protein [Brevibacterium aurantiacum]